MTLTVTIDGRPLPFRLERDGERWLLDGDRQASVLEVEPGIYSVLLGARSFEARIERIGETWAVSINGRRMLLEVSDPRRRRRKSAGAAREGRQQISAPMPGKVVRLLVSEGDAVGAGQGLVVVEAMKMQNEMKAPKAGRIVKLAAQEGATVAAGDVLAIIE